MTVTFAKVSSSGSTQSSSSTTGAPPPAGPAFSCNQGALYYDIDTTASFDGPADVCIGYGDADYTGLTPRLYHFADSGWGDITTSIDGSSHTICRRSSSLSPFVVTAGWAAGADGARPGIVVPATGPDSCCSDVPRFGDIRVRLVARRLVFAAPGDVFVGTTTVSCRATGRGGSAAADFDVDVISARPQLDELSAEVDGSTGLPAGSDRLAGPPEDALSYLDSADVRHACAAPVSSNVRCRASSEPASSPAVVPSVDRRFGESRRPRVLS